MGAGVCPADGRFRACCEEREKCLVRRNDRGAQVADRQALAVELCSSVAELAGSGLTNREVARAAFISPKTVEANLARVYRKLGIRSRAELGAAMSGRET